MSDETNSSEVAKKDSEQQKAGNDVNVVAEHYNSKDKGDLSVRSKSRIFYMRNFNNWIKSVLIKEYVNKLNASSNSSGGLTILDLGCGRGGDIRKWMKASNVRHVTFSDLAEISLDECKSRYEEMRPRFKAEFIHLDATRGLLSEKLDESVKYDLVSSQFVIHYSFESIKQACRFMENVSSNLKPGGYFIGTTTNSNELIRRLKNSDSNSFGNEIYEIKFYQEDKDKFDLFGVKFDFRLDGVVECPEFLLNFQALVKIAKKYGLKLVFKQTFNEFFYKHYDRADNLNLLSLMQALEPYTPELAEKASDEYRYISEKLKEQAAEENGIDSRNRNETYATMSKSEWEAITLYVAFAFVKEEPHNELENEKKEEKSDDNEKEEEEANEEKSQVEEKSEKQVDQEDRSTAQKRKLSDDESN